MRNFYISKFWLAFIALIIIAALVFQINFEKLTTASWIVYLIWPLPILILVLFLSFFTHKKKGVIFSFPKEKTHSKKN